MKMIEINQKPIKQKFNELVPTKFGSMYEPLLTDCLNLAYEHAVKF
jgi:hypothetical protein